ncbi:FadR/GntR family transcriptional regulator [Halotalea alkalilenta]|uniref:GntR family transcriptional regulator n=1 Tax=Halotalea alkalilenta TaxID=376489 RepID=A0A172YD14_9GAMM|nr:FadR/GntR family transcriptional regulator [Halotalea alkalilenta]ANF57113.1 GntR family transcriptional regulator [Halotalea alkalilenta]
MSSTPPARKHRHAEIIRDLGARIVTSELAPGDRLPHESEMLATYGVSRPVLREALRVLGAKGLVHAKPKVGSVVRPRAEWHLLDPDVLGWMVGAELSTGLFEDLFAVRLIIEPAAAALAATAASGDELEAIESAFSKMSRARSRRDRLAPDLEFHVLIARATHNDLLAHLCQMLSKALGESIKVSSRRLDRDSLSLPRHRAILDALRARDPEAARVASLAQIEGARDDFLDVLGDR